MNTLDRHLCTAVLRSIDLAHDLRKPAVLALAPCRRLRPKGEVEVHALRHRPPHHDDFIQTLIHRGAREILNAHIIFVHSENAEVRRGLHLIHVETRHIMDARTQDGQQVDEVTLLCVADDAPCILHRSKCKLHCGIGRAIERMETLLLRDQDVDNLTLVNACPNDRLCRRRNGVACRTARERDNLDLAVLFKRLQGKRECTNRVAAPVADALPRMSAKQALHRNAISWQLRLPARERTREVEVDTARTANRHDMIIFRITVDQKACIREMCRIQTARSRHPLLLVDRDDGAQCAVLLRMLHCSQNFRNADAVVTAEARAVRRQRLLRTYHLDWIFKRIVGDTRLRDTDHVHVPLQDRARRALTACRRGHLGNDVECLILRHHAADLRKAFLQIVADCALVPRGTRNVRQCLKF